jgi:hypothetical protein
MNRQLQLLTCKQCTNRKMDLQKGLICGLTDQKAQFEDTCPDFNKDPKVVIRANEEAHLDSDDAHRLLSDDAYERLRLQQHFPNGMVMATLAALLGAILWAVVSVATGYQIGYMALGIGAGVGFAMRIFGRGLETHFAIAGAVLALVGCFLGNFLSLIGVLANEEGLGYIDTLFRFNYAYFWPIMTETFSVMDLVFYCLAGAEAYKLSIRSFTEQELAEMGS